MCSQMHVQQAEFVQPPLCAHCGDLMRLAPIVDDSSGYGMQQKVARLSGTFLQLAHAGLTPRQEILLVADVFPAL